MIGSVRRSQLIGTYGVGAMIDTQDYSLMILGLDDWPSSELETIHERRLQKKLGVYKFKQPKAVSINDKKAESVPCTRFPRYVFCPYCKRLGDFKDLTGDPQGKVCKACESEYGDDARVIPSRFITVCRNGHIDDFPYQRWIGCSCKRPSLRIEMSGESSSLSSIVVMCKNKGCNNEGRSMQDAFRSQEWRDVACTRNRPWLKDVDDFDCQQPIKVMQRGATSVHFSVTESAISIPPYSSEAYSIVEEKLWRMLKVLPESSVNKGIFDGFAKEYGSSGPALYAAYKFYEAEEEGGNSDSDADSDLKLKEYEVLKNCGEAQDYNEKDEFAARATEIPDSFQRHISKIVLVDKLRVVTALCGFNRVEPTSENLTKISKERPRWYPATEIYGEGIFIELDRKKINEWLCNTGKEVVKRLAKREIHRENLARDNDFIPQENVCPVLVLLHSLSHALIRSLTIECGYSSSSLQERLYWGEEESGDAMHGILIYTASSDAEGSLGGLVRQGLKERFEVILADAIDQANWCSSDPLCIESSGQGFYSLNLAACHSCLLIPEPACELRNCYLDRATLIGTKDKNTSGYFSDL